jgi:ribosomal-protein-alanine N-acetyltransferase
VIQLRPFEKADLAEAFRLDQICFPPSIAYTKAELRCFVSSPTAYALIAEKAARMAGFLVAGHPPKRKSDAAHIVTIDVAPDKRRSGIATMLMDAAEAHYHTLGCATITLEVAVDNAGAQAFYSKRGFLTIGVKRGYYNGVLDAFTMSKVLEDRG